MEDHVDFSIKSDCRVVTDAARVVLCHFPYILYVLIADITDVPVLRLDLREALLLALARTSVSADVEKPDGIAG